MIFAPSFDSVQPSQVERIAYKVDNRSREQLKPETTCSISTKTMNLRTAAIIQFKTTIDNKTGKLKKKMKERESENGRCLQD